MLRLKVLNLTSDFRSAVYFLVRLQLPPMVSVEISADIHNDWDTLVICADLIPFIKGETTLPSNKPLVSFGINCDRCPYVTFLGSRDYLSSLSSLPTDCHLTLNFETTGPFTLIIRSICETIHDELKHIRVLLLGSVEDFDLDMFLAIFRASKHLVKLELTGQNALILPELLLLGTENRRNEIEKTFIFPELHSLIITSFEFKGSNFGGLAVDTFFKQLVQMVQTRQEHRLGPHEITFYDCTNFDGSDEVVKERLSSLVAITSISPMESPNEFGTYAECMEEADGEEEEEENDDDDDEEEEDKLQ
ncbi:hypothetical protein QCA50_000282 [Cerrena zonata]|uniref:Uncharacterized protein n=1 Tax=Cerrena zonata TaxID=2478898 RepID=A0AAW0GQ73_9APHY